MPLLKTNGGGLGRSKNLRRAKDERIFSASDQYERTKIEKKKIKKILKGKNGPFYLPS